VRSQLFGYGAADTEVFRCTEGLEYFVAWPS